MGVYLVSVGAQEWFGGEEDGWGEVTSALNAEFRRRGLPPYEDVPPETDFAPGSGQAFEEKLTPSMTGFLALSETYLSREEAEILCGWTVLVPFSLDEEIWLPVDSDDCEPMAPALPRYYRSPRSWPAAIDLPAETPATCDNLGLSRWFR